VKNGFKYYTDLLNQVNHTRKAAIESIELINSPEYLKNVPPDFQEKELKIFTDLSEKSLTFSISLKKAIEYLESTIKHL
jgi:hypothetical protein